MEQNHENSFWKSNLRSVPGRPSPKKDFKTNKTNSTSSSFENYQKSVSDAWTSEFSEDELTKEYCILSSDDSKVNTRRPLTSAPKSHHKNQLPVVHKATSSTSILTTTTNVNSTSTANNIPPHPSSSVRSFSFDANKTESPPSLASSSSNTATTASSTVDQHPPAIVTTTITNNNEKAVEYG